MAFQPNLSSVYRIIVRGKGITSNQRIFQSFDYAYPAGLVLQGDESSQTLLNNFSTGWGAQFIPRLSVEYQTISMDLLEITDTIRSAVGRSPHIKLVLGRNDTAVVTQTGSIAGDFLPTFDTVTIRKRTGFAGRRNRGSSHFGPVPRTSALANKLTAGELSSWTTAAATFFVPIPTRVGVPTSAMNPVVFSGTDNALAPLPHVPSAHSHLITSTLVNPSLGSVLRRKEKSFQLL